MRLPSPSLNVTDCSLAIRAIRTYRSLPTLESSRKDRSQRPTLIKDLRYSESAKRCVLDLYLPPQVPRISLLSRKSRALPT